MPRGPQQRMGKVPREARLVSAERVSDRGARLLDVGVNEGGQSAVLVDQILQVYLRAAGLAEGVQTRYQRRSIDEVLALLQR